MHKYILLVIIGIIWSCTQQDQEAKSMDQIYQEEGVPVNTRILKPREFMVKRSYHAVLTGIEESSAYADVGDKVEEVFVKVGDYVKKNQILLKFPTDNPNARYFQAKIAYENAKLAYERIRNMFQTGGISKQQLDNAKAEYDVAEANWDAAQQTVLIRAPISGYVTKVDVRESDNVRKEAELFTISRMDRMKARVWIAEKDVREVTRGLPSYALWNGLRIDGKVVEVDMALNHDHQAFGAVVEFENPRTILKFGITVDIHIETYRNPNALVVELKDLIAEEDQYFAYVVQDNKAVKKAVKTGKRYKLNVEIIEGLNSGDELIVAGQMLLEPGATVKIIE